MDQGLEHYKPFSEVYGNSSVEKEVPSKMEGSAKKSVSFLTTIDCSKQQARIARTSIIHFLFANPDKNGFTPQ